MTIAVMAPQAHDGDVLRSIRERLRLTQEEFAEALGVPFTRYRNWEYKKANPPAAVVENAERMTFSPPRPKAQGLLVLRQMPMVPVRLVGTVSGGSGADHHGEEEEAWIPAHLGGDQVAGWRAEGDSMMPWIQPGDIVLAREDRDKRPNLAHIVRTNEGVRVKVLSYRQGAGWQYHSLNPAYPDEPVKESDEIVGYVTGIYRIDSGTEIIISNANGLRPTV